MLTASAIPWCDLATDYRPQAFRVQWASDGWMLREAVALRRQVFCTEQGLFGGGEVGELGGDGGGDFGEEGGDAGAAGFGERDDPAAGVGFVALAGDQAIAFEVGKHEGEIAGAFEDLLGDLASAERAAVVEGFEHPELGDGQVAEKTMGAGGDALGGAHQFDVGVERGDFGGGTLVGGRHGRDGLSDALM